MISFASASLEAILLLSVSANMVHVDGTTNLKRNLGDGLAFAKFAVHKFRYLNLTTLMSASVKKLGECGKLCVDHSSCFSTNLAAFSDQDGWTLCELLPSDRHNNSDKFLENAVFHHLSIKASKFLLHSSCYTDEINCSCCCCCLGVVVILLLLLKCGVFVYK